MSHIVNLLNDTAPGAPKEHPTMIPPFDNLSRLMGQEVMAISGQTPAAVDAFFEGKSL
jgi:hypothetical protein